MTDEERKAYNREKTRRYRANNPDKVRAARHVRKLKVRRRRELLDMYKVAVGCIECGYNRSGAALDFDHINPQVKRFNIAATGVSSRSVKDLMAEVRKCRVLCANCHRIHSLSQLRGAA